MSERKNLETLIQACRRLHASIDELDHTIAEAVGLSRNDLRCLNLLENGPVSPRHIGEALGLSSGSVSALIDRLESSGFVVRRPDPDDRRGVKVEATQAVWLALAKFYRRFADHVRRRFREYNAGELETALRCLHDIADAAQRAQEFASEDA